MCHRLDKETSGAIVFATDEEGARETSHLFEVRKVEKRYLFITRASGAFVPREVHSKIERRGNQFVSALTKDANSVTRFTPLVEAGNLQLWEAHPLTGKPHQIRLHASSEGMPILGDSLYGGAPASRLMLHAYSLSLPGAPEHTSPPPIFFQELSLLSNTFLIDLLTALHKRTMAFAPTDEECLRLLHSEIPSLRCDRYGEIGWFYWYGEKTPTSKHLEAIEYMAGAAGCTHWYCSIMENRGKAESVHRLVSSQNSPKSWQAKEEEIVYSLSAERGRSPGLFLDQRLNRKLVRSLAEGKRVLNLFCYTAGFSVAAALGGAIEVVSVDTSKQTLGWAKENFTLNGLDPSKHRFVHDDAREYLRRCARQKRQFDLIICDPPSFARSKTGVFSLDKELEALLTLLMSVSSGSILFCTNLERLTVETLLERARRATEGTPFSHLRHLPGDIDVELPGDTPLMKSILLSTSPISLDF